MLLICIDVSCGSATTHAFHFLLIFLLQTHHAHYRHYQHDCKDHNRGHGCRHHAVLVRALVLTSVPVVPPVITYGTPTERNVTMFTGDYRINNRKQIPESSGNVGTVLDVNCWCIPASRFYTSVYNTHSIIFTFYRVTWITGRGHGVGCRRDELRRNQVWDVYGTKMGNFLLQSDASMFTEQNEKRTFQPPWRVIPDKYIFNIAV